MGSSVQFTTKLLILVISVFLLNIISIDSKLFDTIFAQNGNNTIGQHRDGDNEASQSEKNSQSTDQNSTCISRDSISLSCNNVAEEKIGGSIGSGEQALAGPQGPQGEKGDTDATGPMSSSGPSAVDGRLYVVVGEGFGGKVQVIKATTYCDEGDTVMGGGYDRANRYTFSW